MMVRYSSEVMADLPAGLLNMAPSKVLWGQYCQANGGRWGSIRISEEDCLPQESIKSQLEYAILRASKIEPKLAKRLKEIRVWIKNKKEGQITSKKFVLMLLRQLIKDSQVWLDIKESNPHDRQVLL